VTAAAGLEPAFLKLAFMETYSLQNGHRSENPIKRQIGDLIGKIGAPSFEPAFFRIVREATACEHVTAFASSDRAPGRLLLALNRGAKPVARTIAEKYLKHYWNHDPANRLCGRNAAPTYEMAVRVFCQDIDHDAYRRDCYSAVDLVDRFSIIKHHGEETIRLNLYRSAQRGRFVVTDFAAVLECADVVFALLAKHDAQRIGAGGTGEADVFAQRLRRLMPKLPPRELDVCVGIMQGKSSEAIALALGISVNTVLTYRKRAYARLGITSHNELMRRVLV
jgi:DNA-binding CsgD family transcriptional regulator